jgi:hypothetical protein
MKSTRSESDLPPLKMSLWERGKLAAAIFAGIGGFFAGLAKLIEVASPLLN